MRQLVYYRTNQPVGTLVVDKNQTFLYVVRPNVSALRYNIGVGPECTTLSGMYHVVRKEEPKQSGDALRARALPRQGLPHSRIEWRDSARQGCRLHPPGR